MCGEFYNSGMGEDILHYARMPWPTDWTAVFGREAPLLVEIGFGGGQFLVDLAQKRPSTNILGIEISLPSLRKGAKKVRLAQLTNTQVLQGDSKAVLWLQCLPQSLAEVYINFPDPWPKAGHQQRRLISDTFLHLLATRMQDGGLLDIATDHADYAEVITACLERTPYFDSRLSTTFVNQDETRLRTKYETKGLQEGRLCHYYKWVRNTALAPDSYAILEELPMPHVVMTSPDSLETIASRFTAQTLELDAVNIKFLDLYQSTRPGKLLVETYVREEPFHQRVCLEMRQRRQGDFVISLAEVGFPRPTHGIHLAVHALVVWLQSQSPESRVLNSTLKLTE